MNLNLLLNKLKITVALVAAFALVGVAATVPATPAGAAVNPLKASCKGGGKSSEVCNSRGKLFGGNSIMANVISTLIFLAGAAAVIVIIIGGIYYVLAAGDESKIKTAKNTIMYAVVGLIFVIAAGGIVRFVLDRL